MDQQRLGRALQVAGALLIVLGLIGFLTTGGDKGEPNTTAAGSTTAPTSAPTSTAPPTTTTSTAPPTTTTSTAPTTTTTTTTTTTAPETAEEFFDLWIAAFDDGDIDFLLSRLNQATLDIWGVDGCRAYLESVAGTAGEIRLREVGADVDWQYQDGVVIEGATEIEVERVVNEQTLIQVLHWQRVDGRWSWFTICG